jgi:hypothetical protein
MMQDFCQATHPNPPNPNEMQGANGQRNGGKTIRHHNKTTDKQNRSKTLSRRLWPVTSVLDIKDMVLSLRIPSKTSILSSQALRKAKN